jgi:hypothetical protein
MVPSVDLVRRTNVSNEHIVSIFREKDSESPRIAATMCLTTDGEPLVTVPPQQCQSFTVKFCCWVRCFVEYALISFPNSNPNKDIFDETTAHQQ